MPELTSGAQQLATWSTGDFMLAIATIGFVIAGILCYQLGRGIAAAVAVVIGTAIAFAGKATATSIRGWVIANLDLAHPVYAHLDGSRHAVGSLARAAVGALLS